MTLLDDSAPPRPAVHPGQLFELIDAAAARLAMATADLATLQDLVPQLAAALTTTAATGPAPDRHTVTADLLRDVLEGRGGMEPLAGRLGRPGGSWFLIVLTDAAPTSGWTRATTTSLSPGAAAALAGMLRSGAAATPIGGDSGTDSGAEPATEPATEPAIELAADLVVIAPYTGAADAVRLAERMRARFAARCGRDLVGCVSEAFTATATGTPTDLAALCRTLRRAATGFAGSAATSTDPGAPKVITATQLRPQLMLAELAECAHGHSGVDEGPLAILREHDGDRGTDFLGSLLAYFDAGGDVTEAAKRLHVHRNTLRYRLQRIEELAGTRLNVPLERFTLELQVRLHFVNA